MNNDTIRFAERMSQLPPYLFGMINKIKMEKRWEGIDVIDLGMGNPMDPTPNKVTEKLCELSCVFSFFPSCLFIVKTYFWITFSVSNSSHSKIHTYF